MGTLLGQDQKGDFSELSLGWLCLIFIIVGRGVVDCLLVMTLCNILTKLKFVRDQTAVKKLKIEKAVESKQGNSGLRLKKVHKVCFGEVWSLDYVRRISSPFSPIYGPFSKNTHWAHFIGLSFLTAKSLYPQVTELKGVPSITGKQWLRQISIKLPCFENISFKVYWRKQKGNLNILLFPIVWVSSKLDI